MIRRERGEVSSPSQGELDKRRRMLGNEQLMIDVLDGKVPRIHRKKAGKILAKIKDIVGGLEPQELKKLKSVLDERDVAILERRVLSERPEPLRCFCEMFGVTTKERVRQIEKRLLVRIERWKNGEPLIKTNAPKAGIRVQIIESILDEMLEKGRTIDGIIDEIGINPLEKKVLELYLLSDEKLTQKQVGERLDIDQKKVSGIIGKISIRLIQLEREDSRNQKKRL